MQTSAVYSPWGTSGTYVVPVGGQWEMYNNVNNVK